MVSLDKNINLKYLSIYILDSYINSLVNFNSLYNLNILK